MHLKYSEILAIVVHENMKLGDNTLNNEALTCKRKISDKMLANCNANIIGDKLLLNFGAKFL